MDITVGTGGRADVHTDPPLPLPPKDSHRFGGHLKQAMMDILALFDVGSNSAK